MQDLHFIRDKIVIPALVVINAYSVAAEQLVMATGMAESLYRHNRQIVSRKPLAYGPARGYWQMEPSTHDDLWSRWIGATRRTHVLEGLRKISDCPGDIDELVDNPVYAAAMCRIKYLSIPAALPNENDFQSIGAYWKRWYNTPLGAGTVDGFLRKIGPVMEMYR